MSKNQLKIQAADRGRGMDMIEVTNALAQARTAGFNHLGRTEIGFKGQIQSMTFEERETKS